MASLFLILVIACINYISLALTTSASRRTEVGIRKAVGAQKKQLVYQFGFESILLALISMIIGVCLVFLFLPYFNYLPEKEFRLTGVDLVTCYLYCVGIDLDRWYCCGKLPGTFSCLVFRPARCIKGQIYFRLHCWFYKATGGCSSLHCLLFSSSVQ